MKIALLGAGGKMGVRLATNLKGSRYEVAHVEIGEAGRARLRETLGVECVDMDAALAAEDVEPAGTRSAAIDDMIGHADRMQQMVGTTPDLETLRGMMTKQMDLVQNMQKAMYEMIATAAFENAKKARNDESK